MTQRTLKNKQFNIHKTGVKINEKQCMNGLRGKYSLTS